jgi:hypothetical protein
VSNILTDAEANEAWKFSTKNHRHYYDENLHFILSERDICLLEEQDRKTRKIVEKELRDY